MSECTINLLKGNIPLSKTQYDKFYKCKDAIRTLANRKNSLKAKKEVINQRGGFLNVLLPLALTAIIELIHKKKKKK